MVEKYPDLCSCDDTSSQPNYPDKYGPIRVLCRVRDSRRISRAVLFETIYTGSWPSHFLLFYLCPCMSVWRFSWLWVRYFFCRASEPFTHRPEQSRYARRLGVGSSRHGSGGVRAQSNATGPPANQSTSLVRACRFLGVHALISRSLVAGTPVGPQINQLVFHGHFLDPRCVGIVTSLSFTVAELHQIFSCIRCIPLHWSVPVWSPQRPLSESLLGVDVWEDYHLDYVHYGPTYVLLPTRA